MNLLLVTVKYGKMKCIKQKPTARYGIVEAARISKLTIQTRNTVFVIYHRRQNLTAGVPVLYLYPLIILSREGPYDTSTFVEDNTSTYKYLPPDVI